MLCCCKYLKCLVSLNASVRALVRQRTERTSALGKTARAFPTHASIHAGCLDLLPLLAQITFVQQRAHKTGELKPVTAPAWNGQEQKLVTLLSYGIMHPNLVCWNQQQLDGDPEHRVQWEAPTWTRMLFWSQFLCHLLQNTLSSSLFEDKWSSHWMQEQMIPTLDL